MHIWNWKSELKTIPNLLSLFRLVLIPVYMAIYLQAETAGNSYYYIAGGILAVSCLTDIIDGKIARHFNMVTTLGKVLDPVADKATQLALFVCLAIRHSVLWILIGIFAVKEGYQLFAMLFSYRKGKVLTGAHISGKICTTVLFLSLIIMVLFPDLDVRIVYALTAVDAILLLISFYNYVRIYTKPSVMIEDFQNPQQ